MESENTPFIGKPLTLYCLMNTSHVSSLSYASFEWYRSDRLLSISQNLTMVGSPSATGEYECRVKIQHVVKTNKKKISFQCKLNYPELIKLLDTIEVRIHPFPQIILWKFNLIFFSRQLSVLIFLFRFFRYNFATFEIYIFSHKKIIISMFGLDVNY